MNVPIDWLMNSPIVVHVLVGIARAVMGYAENCAKAKKLLPFQFSKMLETVFRVGFQSFGWGAVGLPPGTAILSDMGIYAVKKKQETKG